MPQTQDVNPNIVFRRAWGKVQNVETWRQKSTEKQAQQFNWTTSTVFKPVAIWR